MSLPVYGTAATTAGSAMASVSGATGPISVGSLVVGTGIPPATTVQSVKAGSVIFSQPATMTGSPVLYFVACVGPFAKPLAYYLSLVTSQYQGPAPKMIAWLAASLRPLQDVCACAEQMLTAWDLRTAVGVQLDALGAAIGPSRTLPFQPSPYIITMIVGVSTAGTGYAVNDVVGISQPGAIGAFAKVISVGGGGAVTGLVATSYGYGYFSAGGGLATFGGSGTGLTVGLSIIGTPISPVLDDTTFRVWLQTVIIANHWNGQLSSIQPQPAVYASCTTTAGSPVVAVNRIYTGSFSAIQPGQVVANYDLNQNTVFAQNASVVSVDPIAMTFVSSVPASGTTISRYTAFYSRYNSMLAALNALFGAGAIAITDNGNMTATVSVGIGILGLPYGSIIMDLLLKGFIVPRPQGVQYTYHVAKSPVFGFDTTNNYIAGFDTGYFF